MLYSKPTTVSYDKSDQFECILCKQELHVSEKSGRIGYWENTCKRCVGLSADEQWAAICEAQDKDIREYMNTHGPNELVQFFKGGTEIYWNQADGRIDVIGYVFISRFGEFRRTMYGDYTYEQIEAAERTSRRKNARIPRPIWVKE